MIQDEAHCESGQDMAGDHNNQQQQQQLSVEELERDFLRLTHLQFVASKLLVKIVASVEADLGENGETALHVSHVLSTFATCKVYTMCDIVRV